MKLGLKVKTNFFDNERVTDEELLEEDKEDGMWQVEIYGSSCCG